MTDLSRDDAFWAARKEAIGQAKVYFEELCEAGHSPPYALREAARKYRFGMAELDRWIN